MKFNIIEKDYGICISNPDYFWYNALMPVPFHLCNIPSPWRKRIRNSDP